MADAQLSLFDALPAPARTQRCHYCGTTLTEPFIPATCELDLACTSCCVLCHHEALGRIMAKLLDSRGKQGRPPFRKPERRNARQGGHRG